MWMSPLVKPPHRIVSSPGTPLGSLTNPLIFIDLGIAAIRRESVDVPTGYGLERDHGNSGAAASKIRGCRRVRGRIVWLGPSREAGRVIGGRYARRHAVRLACGRHYRPSTRAGQGIGYQARDQAG